MPRAVQGHVIVVDDCMLPLTFAQSRKMAMRRLLGDTFATDWPEWRRKGYRVVRAELRATEGEATEEQPR